MTSRTKIFISYSHEDERWRKRLVGHLAVLALEGVIDLYDDRQLAAGDDWFARLHEQMLNARIALLLVSSDFLTSKFIREEEVPRLFEQHEKGGMTVYPLLVKPCPWQEVGWLAKMQLRPRDAKAVASFRGSRVDEVLVEVAREISSLAKGAEAARRPDPSGPPGPATPPDIRGEWTAEVVYDWPNARFNEVFSFQVDGDAVFGTASFLGVKRAISESLWSGDRLTFVTRTREVLGSEDASREVVHRYRGVLSDAGIRLVMQTEGGSSEHLPVEFIARRVAPEPARSPKSDRSVGT